MDAAEAELRQIYRGYHLYFSSDELETKLIRKALDLFKNDIIFEPHGDIENCILGVYHQYITKDYVACENYYKIAIGCGNTKAIHRLALHLIMNKKDHNSAHKYCQMGMAYDKSRSLNLLGYLYDCQEDYENAKKYYLESIALGNGYAAYNLGSLYIVKEKNLAKSKKYFRIALQRKRTDALKKLEILGRDNNFELMELYLKYPHLTTRTKIIDSIKKVSNEKLNEVQSSQFVKILVTFQFTPEDDLPTSLQLLINSLKHQINILDLHFKYNPNGEGCKKAHKDFLKNISKSKN